MDYDYSFSSIKQKDKTMEYPKTVGSFARSTETKPDSQIVLARYNTKDMIRKSLNAAVVIEDCGTTLGESLLVSISTMKRLIGFTVVDGDVQSRVHTLEEASLYLGKTVNIRSPLYCRAGNTDLCKTCVGYL